MTGSTETQMLGGAGYGSGFGGFAPFGLFGILGLNNGLGYGANSQVDNCLSQRITDLQIAGVNQNINSAEANLTAQNLSQTNNLGQIIYDQGFNGINTTRTVGEVLGASIGGVKDSVQASQFQTSLQTKEILESNNANTQAILNKLCEQETQALRDALQDEKTARQFAERGILTATGPAMSVIPNRCPESQQADIVNAVNIAVGNGIAQGIAQIAPMLGKSE